MADIRKLYFELIRDYDAYADLTVHAGLTESEMLYNLIAIKENNDISNCDTKEEIYIFNRFNTLIDLFKLLGISPIL